jgi:hypothetical protein
VTAEITDAEERRVVVEASVQDESGLVLAHARAECAHVRPEHFLSTPKGRELGTDWLPR